MRRLASIHFSMVNICDDMVSRLNLSKSDIERNMINGCLYDLGFVVGFHIPLIDPEYLTLKNLIYPIILGQVIGIPADSSFIIYQYDGLYVIDFDF